MPNWQTSSGAEAIAQPSGAERRTLSQALISGGRKLRAGVVALVLSACALQSGSLPALAAERGVAFVSPEAALDQGVNAYRGGYTELAIPALRFAAVRGEFFAQYLLAMILSDNAGAHTSHGEAFQLLHQIVNSNFNVDPDDDPRAPYVSRSLLQFGEYLSRGVPELKKAPDPAMALPYIEHAAKFFGNRDAQFVFAKMLLSGEGGRRDPGLALHFLSTLVQDGHAGAQAFLGEQYWRGTHVPKDEARALALAELAVKGASPTDYLWIDEIYQNIYCNMNEPGRREARPLVQRWGQFFGWGGRTQQQRGERDRMALGFVPTRTCEDGKPVPLLDEMRGINMRMPSDGVLTASPQQPSAPKLEAGAVRDVGAPGR